MRRKWLKRTSKSKQEQETNKKQGIEEPATPFSRINKKEEKEDPGKRKQKEKKIARTPPVSRDDRPVGFMSVFARPYSCPVPSLALRRSFGRTSLRSVVARK
jgi:hypothetical protein